MAPIFVNDPDQTSQVPVSRTATPPSLTNRQQSHQTFPTALAGFHCSLVASESDWLTGLVQAGNQVRLLVVLGWMGESSGEQLVPGLKRLWETLVKAKEQRLPWFRRGLEVVETVVVIRRRSESSRSFRLYSGTCPAHPVEREEKREEEWQEDGGWGAG